MYLIVAGANIEPGTVWRDEYDQIMTFDSPMEAEDEIEYIKETYPEHFAAYRLVEVDDLDFD